jgi:hypothetical protein
MRFACLVFAVLVGCVSDNSSTTPGTLNGPCFANNTCNTGLACVLVSGTGVCMLTDAAPTEAGMDAGADASAPDADAAVEAGCDAGTPHLACGAKCPLGGDGGAGNPQEVCCPTSGGTCIADTHPDAGGVGSCLGGMVTWVCQSSADCMSNETCCVIGTVDTAACPPELTQPVNATCSASCNGHVLCTSTAQCSGSQACVAAKMIQAQATIGLCM